MIDPRRVLAYMLPLHHELAVLDTVELHCEDCGNTLDNNLVQARFTVIGEAMIHLRWRARCTHCGTGQRGEQEYRVVNGKPWLQATSWALGMDDSAEQEAALVARH